MIGSATRASGSPLALIAVVTTAEHEHQHERAEQHHRAQRDLE
jgi:hypothetical protein